MKYKILFFFITYLLSQFSCLILFSQKITNVDFKLRDNKIIITFDMINFPKENNYDISILFADSANNIIIPESSDLKASGMFNGLKRFKKNSLHRYNNGLTVDAGQNILGNTTHEKIKWNVLNNLDKLKGYYQLIIEVQTGYYSIRRSHTPGNIIKIEGRSNFKKLKIQELFIKMGLQLMRKPCLPAILSLPGHIS